VIRRRLGHAPHVGATPGRDGVPARAAEPVAPDPDVAILAPLTGVFYSAASPDSPPFVTAGEPIQAGQTACIIEAMKVFNEIKAEVGGTVTAIAAKNGQLVQKGDALIRVQPV
jgi:biotin carboxyl carrier protein